MGCVGIPMRVRVCVNVRVRVRGFLGLSGPVSSFVQFQQLGLREAPREGCALLSIGGTASDWASGRSGDYKGVGWVCVCVCACVCVWWGGGGHSPQHGV